MSGNPNLERILSRIDAFAARRATTCARAIHNSLQRLNPYRTGHSRANWLVFVGFGVIGVVGSPKSPASGAAAASLVELDSYTVDRGPIHIINSVPYIRLIGLPPGTSTQAPGGFVSAAILDGMSRARERR